MMKNANHLVDEVHQFSLGTRHSVTAALNTHTVCVSADVYLYAVIRLQPIYCTVARHNSTTS